MATQPEQLQVFSKEFNSLVERMNESHTLSTEERRRNLRRMRELMVEIDKLIAFKLKRETTEPPH
jgi:hypothetical protein